MDDQTEQLNTIITDNKKVQISSLVVSKGILLVLSPNLFGETSILDDTQHLIGRTPECNFIVNDSLVSKRHCIITNEDGKFFLEDIGSRNGTFLNGKPIKKKTALFYGDKITIGETIIRFYLEEKLDKK